MAILRPEIPPLTPRYQAVPGNFNLKRNYPCGTDQFLRLNYGQVMPIEVEAPELAGYTVYLNGNLPLPEDQLWLEEEEPGRFTGEVSILKPGKYFFYTEFQVPEDTRPQRDRASRTRLLVDPEGLDNVRLYTLIPNVSGTITDWIADLPRIQKMGFTHIHLLPITTMDVSESPYSAADLFEVDDFYRDPSKPGSALDQFESFVEAAREHTIGLCFDLVLNHIGVTSRMAQQCPDWIVRDEKRPDGFKRAGCRLGDSWHTWEDLALINYNHPDKSVRDRIWDYMNKYMLFWGSYARETGGMIRLDNLHSSDEEFIQIALKNFRAECPNVYILAELFCEGKDLKQYVFDHHLHLLLSTPWEQHFVPQLRGMIQFQHDVYPTIKFIMPISSHDSGTPTQEFHDVHATLPRYAMSVLCNTGATGLCQGAEIGVHEKINFIKRQGKIEFPVVRDFHEDIRQLNGLMDSYPAFQEGGNLRFIDNNHDAVIAVIRTPRSPYEASILVCLNFDLHGEHTLDVGEHQGVQGDELRLLYGENQPEETALPTRIHLHRCGVAVFLIKR